MPSPRKEIVPAKARAFSATHANGTLGLFEDELGPIGLDQVDIAVESCCIRLSDLSIPENP